jgi:hypothetical protein
VSDFAAELDQLGARLELELTADGGHANPLVVLELDRWRDAPPEYVVRAAGLLAAALPVTAGVLTGPPAAGLEPLINAATLTLAPSDFGHCTIISADDIPGALPGTPDVAGAVDRLRAAILYSPRAAIACGQLVRQTAVLPVPTGLAAEATAYSLLLGGAEFACWLAARGAPRQRASPTEPVRVTRDGAGVLQRG